MIIAGVLGADGADGDIDHDLTPYAGYGRSTPETHRTVYAPGVGACDVGGPLSHSSVLAREYGIPAVLGAGAATEWLRDGPRIVVDGEAGVLTPAAR
ncbi:PEP-utilizing enzyme [Streptosporangium canum]|uniref:PEP-utilizing enzyme n=1 Tax=Streptosporangium canum TaxID=324952 RepID=UPI00343104A3